MNAESRALVLDFGGVVTRTLFETHDATESALGLPPGTLTWRGPFDPDSDPLWQAMQREQISERDYWSTRTHEVAALVGEPWSDMSQFVRRARGAEPMAVIRPEALAAIAMAHSCGVRLGILSNELDLFYGADFKDKLPFMKLFRSVVDATYTGILKPDARAYRASISALGVAAENCVFVDDQIKNIRGAQALDMRTVHFDVQNPGTSYATALEMLGVTVQET